MFMLLYAYGVRNMAERLKRFILSAIIFSLHNARVGAWIETSENQFFYRPYIIHRTAALVQHKDFLREHHAVV